MPRRRGRQGLASPWRWAVYAAALAAGLGYPMGSPVCWQDGRGWRPVAACEMGPAQLHKVLPQPWRSVAQGLAVGLALSWLVRRLP